ncbi:MAG TPA: HIT family protein [Myxococcaceae bacterium]|jgi:histidine triad (HIT) family protein|nr:HIT family protein [Myxococcaceae bacterium]
MAKDCIFCRIAAGELDAHRVYESPNAVAILDTHPAARGHTMVIPRAHAPTLVDLDDDAVGEVFRTVKLVMRRIQDVLHPIAFNVGWNHGAAAGQHVFHLHVHVLPRYREAGRGVQALGEGTDRHELASLAESLRKA